MRVVAVRDVETFGGKVTFEVGHEFEVAEEYEHSYLVKTRRDPLLNKQHYAQLSKTDVELLED